jgi:FkbM family methyltransferase
MAAASLETAQALIRAALAECDALLAQPGAPLGIGLAAVALSLVGAALLAALFGPGGRGAAAKNGAAAIGGGNRTSLAQLLFRAYVRVGRLRNALCSPCDRARAR